MPSVVESRRIFAETRKKRIELDSDYSRGRHAAPHPDPVNLRSLRCISQIVLEATKETKQAKHFLELMGVDVDKVDEGELLDLCSPIHAYQAIRLREALLQLAELRRILRERIGQANVPAEEERMRKILLKEMQQLRKALSTSHLGRNIQDVEASLNNLRETLDSFTFSDEVQQYARKAALAVAQIQGISISHPLMKALAQQYSSKHGSLEEASGSQVPVWKRGTPSANANAWRAGGNVTRKEESSVSKAVSDEKPGNAKVLARGASLAREEVDLHDLFQADDEEEDSDAPNPPKKSGKRRSSKGKNKVEGKQAKRRNSRAPSDEAPEEARDKTFEVDPLPKKRPSVAKGPKGLAKASAVRPVEADRSRQRHSNNSGPREESKGFTFRKQRDDPKGEVTSTEHPPFGSELPSSVAARKPHGQPPSPSSAFSGPPSGRATASASATPGSTPSSARRDSGVLASPYGIRDGKDGVMSARSGNRGPFPSPTTSTSGLSSAPMSARMTSNSLQRISVSEHLAPERMGSGSHFKVTTQKSDELEVDDFLGMTSKTEATTASSAAVTDEANYLLDFLGSTPVMPTSFQKIEEPINDNQRSTSGRFLLGSEALTGDGSMSIGTASGHRPSTEGDKPRSRGAQKRVSWAPLMRSNPAKEEKVLRPLVTRVNTAGIIPPLPRRPITSNLENLQGNIAEDEELEPKEPMKEPIHHEDSPLLVSRPLNLPTGWSKRPDKVPSFVRSKDPVEVSTTHLMPDMEEHAIESVSSSTKEIVSQFCTQDLQEWCAEEEVLRWLFSATPEPSEPDEDMYDLGFDSCDDLGQEQSTMSFISRSISCSSISEDDQEEFLRELRIAPGFFESHGREPPHMSSTGGLPQVVAFLHPPVTSPRQVRDDDKVYIETVLAYRTRRGFREAPVISEYQEKYEAKMTEISTCGIELPCFCRRCLLSRQVKIK